MGTPRKKKPKKTPAADPDLKHCVLCEAAMQLVTLRAEGIECEGYRCTGCGNEVVTIPQMKAYAQAAKLRDILPTQRKVIRMGNSIGITLPKETSRFGLAVGSTVRITYVTDTGFYIEPVDPPKGKVSTG